MPDSQAPKRFLITGGAGFLGINLCRYLLARGHSVRTIDIAPFDYPERSRVDVIDGDIRDPRAVARAMNGIEIVVHAAAALPLASPEDIFSTAVQGTRLLLEHAVAHGVSRFIFTSSTAVYGIPDHHPIIESDPLRGVGPYGKSKIEAEAICRADDWKGLCVSVLRPKSFVGPERLGAFELLYDWAYSGHNFPVLGRGDNLYQLLDVEDLCRAIELCAFAPPAVAHDVFNVGAAEFGTMRDNFQAVLDAAGHGGRVISLPRLPAIVLLEVFEALHISPLYRWIYETAAEESFVSIQRIFDRLGYRPYYSNETALVRNYDWYVQHHKDIRPTPGVTHRVPWKKGVLRVAKAFF